MPRAPKKAVEPSQPLPKPTPTPPPGPAQQQIQCKTHANTHAVLLGLGALLVASFGMNLSALAASKKAEPTHEALGGYVQSLETKVDKLQRQLDSISAQLLKACNDVSNACLDKDQTATEDNQEDEDVKTPLTPTKK